MNTPQIQYKNKGLILINIVILTFMACLDGSIVNVALPVMANSFKVGMNSISIIVSVYLIAISGTILIFGRLGDTLGAIKIFKFGIVVFTLGSLLCALANSLGFLIFARIIQAIGAAGFMATNQGILTRVFPAGERGRALGITGSFVALGTLVGPPLGGFIVDVVSWKYIFLINLPIGLFAFIFGTKILPEDEQMDKARFDYKGAILFLVFIVSLFTALIVGEKAGFSKPYILGAFALAIISFILFLRVESREQSPILQLGIFKNQLFSLSILCGFLLFISINVSSIIMPFYLQDVVKQTPAVAGLYMMIYPLVLFVVSPVSGHISDKIGSEVLTFLGLVVYGTSFFMLSTLTQHFNSIKFILFVAIMALGNGMFQSPNNSLVMSSVPRNMVGIAGSINALIRNFGLVVGVSFSTLVLYGVMSSRLGYSVTTFVNGKEADFVYAMSIAFICAGIIALIGAVLTALRLIAKRRKKLTK